jgi:tetratricopeptide (TPR) repeat protein
MWGSAPHLRFNQSIALNPKYARAYKNRGNLKNLKFNDRPGAIQDFRTAAKLFRARGQAKDLQETINLLRSLGATE